MSQPSTPEPANCLFCTADLDTPPAGQEVIGHGEQWRVTALSSAVVPMVFVSAVRHVGYVWELADDQAAALGSTLRDTAAALRGAAGADLVLTCGFGQGVAHCHFALLAYREGDPLVGLAGNFTPGATAAPVEQLAATYEKMRGSYQP